MADPRVYLIGYREVKISGQWAAVYLILSFIKKKN